MQTALCTHPDYPVLFTASDFERFTPEKIDIYRYFLKCPECGAASFYRKKTADGKAACFGSRYHIDSCKEISNQYQKNRSTEIKSIIESNGEIIIDMNYDKKSLINTPHQGNTVAIEELKKNQKPSPGYTRVSKKDLSNEIFSLEEILACLLRGDGLDKSNTMIKIGEKYTWKAKNLFVNFELAQPSNKPKVFWGVISHTDDAMEWLNPLERKDTGIPISSYKEELFSRYSINDRASLEGICILVFGQCFSNKEKNRLIIRPWDNNVNNICLMK
ncbi:hypothetical protein [Aeromonas veronii]|uniref:hypothetical protein n=1 Tax=Aeromonas veronii TaxID=654 RepID=UPI003D21B932